MQWCCQGRNGCNSPSEIGQGTAHSLTVITQISTSEGGGDCLRDNEREMSVPMSQPITTRSHTSPPALGGSGTDHRLICRRGDSGRRGPQGETRPSEAQIGFNFTARWWRKESSHSNSTHKKDDAWMNTMRRRNGISHTKPKQYCFLVGKSYLFWMM